MSISVLKEVLKFHGVFQRLKLKLEKSIFKKIMVRLVYV